MDENVKETSIVVNENFEEPPLIEAFESTETIRCSNSNSFIETIQHSMKRIRWKLYLTLLLRTALPSIYLTVRVFVLGSLPNEHAVSIASQMAWVNVILEVIEETLLQPLYHCFGSTISDRLALKNKVKTGFIVCLAVYVCFSSVTAGLARPLVEIMGQSEGLHQTTIDYIRLQLCGIIASSLGKFFMLVLILLEKNLHLFIALLVQMLVSVLLDVFLVSQFKFSLQLGVIGAAYSSIATAVAIFVYTFVACWREIGMKCSDLCSSYDFSWFKRWTRVGLFSALDSFTRNAVYIVVVLRAMNLLKHQDSYWITNNFIWSWLLIPVIPLSDLLKQDVSSRQPLPHKKKLCGYFIIACAIFVSWLVSIPGWKLFLKYVFKAKEIDLVYEMALQLLPCYIFFVLNTIFSSVFYGHGRTELLFIGSILASVVLVVPFLMMTFNVLTASVKLVAGVFGAGLIVGSIISGIEYLWLIRKLDFVI